MLVQKDVLHQAHLRLRAHAHHPTREQTKLETRLQSTRTEWAAASRANQHMVNELRNLRMQLVRFHASGASIPGLGSESAASWARRHMVDELHKLRMLLVRP